MLLGDQSASWPWETLAGEIICADSDVQPFLDQIPGVPPLVLLRGLQKLPASMCVVMHPPAVSPQHPPTLSLSSHQDKQG